MASLNVAAKPEVVGLLARLEREALQGGVSREGAVRCERGRGRFFWSINGNRAKKQDCAVWLEQ